MGIRRLKLKLKEAEIGTEIEMELIYTALCKQSRKGGKGMVKVRILGLIPLTEYNPS